MTLLFKKIGHAIGPVLRVDAHMANGARGRFARLYIQVNLDKPLLTMVLIRQKHIQPIQYEGINQLCFYCGRIGHRKKGCPFVVRALAYTSSLGDDLSEAPIGSPNIAGSETFGEWMVVSRKKISVTLRKAFVAETSGIGRDVNVKVDLGSNLSSSTLASVDHREGKRKTLLSMEKVAPPPITFGIGCRRKGKSKLVNSKTINPKSQSDPYFLVQDSLGSPLKLLSIKQPFASQPQIFSFGDGTTSGKLGDFSKKIRSFR